MSATAPRITARGGVRHHHGPCARRGCADRAGDAGRCDQGRRLLGRLGRLSFSAASTAFDYLAQGEVLTLTYTVAINDGDGGVTSQDFVITVTGTNDAPSIVGEVDPAAQTVIVAAPTSLDRA